MAPPPKFTGQLRGKVAVVLGGSSGLGLGVAQGLVEEGAHVVISSSSQDKVDKAIAQLNDAGTQYNADPSRVSGYVADLSGADVEASVTELFRKVGTFDHLIYTAGDAPKALPLKDHTFETITSAGQVRFVSALLAIKAAVYGGHLKEGGSIVLTTGAVFKYPVPDWTVVAGYAGGLASLVRSLAFELSGNCIRVNGVAPGPTKTALFAGAPAGLEDKLAKTVLVDRVAQPEEVAISYLSLLKNPNINGEVIHDDGGSYAPKQPKSG